MTVYHDPVLANEIARLAEGRRRAADLTVGGGGHAELLLRNGAELFAVDRDPEALARARERLEGARVTWKPGRFGDPDVLAALKAFRPDFVLLDLGISSRHIDEDARGFSFRPGVPLDMRMSQGAGETAADVLNSRTAEELAEMFRTLADERHARRLARVIVDRRSRALFATSDDFVNAIRAALGPRSGPPDFARLFQAVRIEVNGELQDLEAALPAALVALEPGGILAVISYHSGEDRIVKNLFRTWASSCICPPGQPVCTCRGTPLGTVTTRKPVSPSEEEIAANPRARSAHLRVFRKTDGG